MSRRRLVGALAAAFAASLVYITPTPALAYSGSGAASYADTYAINPNSPSYPVFSSDCTNFISQAASEGGGYPFRNAFNNATSDTSWWIEGSGYSTSNFTWSDSWSVADGYYNFLMADLPGGIPEGTASGTSTAYWTPSAMVDGDMLFYDWGQGLGISHATIQVGYGIDPNQYPNKVYDGNYVDEHTTNRYHAFWSLYPYNPNASTTTIYFVHIDASN
ncbi:amidase domain-containing protein [Streptomyces sp. TRM68367]|uniref:amidase domain-containing protein n=1 Tax=Streptomyces sp. TRM68367 TaxID=2758415 RepID=UPI00165C66ED|nr:amidase domain-containing protein [Streptomyces sp. TRM68367]MBC9729843.1 amidase domain-containing protein [Streptomyces sp. TRM68367]